LKILKGPEEKDLPGPKKITVCANVFNLNR
jgi:hypothetical protein